MKAYITLLSNDSYLPGVLVLNKSLKAVNSKYQLYCAISMNVSNKIDVILKNKGVQCIRLSHTAISDSFNLTDDSYSRWNYTFDKLLIWGLTQFEKIVFLDSDMIILKNIDSLFECEAFSAVSAGKEYPGNENWTGLNSGLMVVIPNKEVERELLLSIRPVVEDFQRDRRPVGDQDVIKRYLSDSWVRNKELHLDQGYNMFADYLTYYVKCRGYSIKDNAEKKKVYVIHFVGRYKPWNKKNVKTYLWLIRSLIRNPLYFKVYRLFRSYLKQCL